MDGPQPAFKAPPKRGVFPLFSSILQRRRQRSSVIYGRWTTRERARAASRVAPDSGQSSRFALSFWSAIASRRLVRGNVLASAAPVDALFLLERRCSVERRIGADLSVHEAFAPSSVGRTSSCLTSCLAREILCAIDRAFGELLFCTRLPPDRHRNGPQRHGVAARPPYTEM